MELSDKRDFLVLFCLHKMTYRNFFLHQFRNMTIRCRPYSAKWLYAAKFEKMTFRNWQTAESQCKCHQEYTVCSGLLKIAPYHLIDLKAAENGLMFLLWCPLKIQKEKREGLQLTQTNYLSILLTPVRIRWTIPLNSIMKPSISEQIYLPPGMTKHKNELNQPLSN
jgi:hypothetical protein